MISEKEYEIDEICLKIIKDHLSYKAYPETYKELADEDTLELEDILFRQKIIKLILNKECLVALDLVEEEELRKLLIKQSFVELVQKNETDKALALGTEYLNKYDNDDIFSVIGYSDLQDIKIKHFFDENASIDLSEKINESLFENKKKRNASLLMIAWFHYKSIQSFLHK
ncbi:hypothetical protein H312_03031, partial [Anncaliia algerae PRA339]